MAVLDRVRQRKTLKDEPLEYRQEQYDEKNDVLDQFGEQVSPITMYEDIFGDTSMLMPVVLIDEEEQKHVVKMTIDEAVEIAQGRNDVLLGGSTYFKEYISKATAKDIHALIIDMDNVYSGPLLRALQNDWALENGEPRPMPTYIVNSGVGLHLYFVFERPIPNYKVQTESIDRLYRALATQQTTGRVYLQKQVQWFGQDFRMAGGCGKDGWENTAFRVGKKWEAADLAAQIGLTDLQFVYPGDRREIKKQLKERVRQKSGTGWRCNRRFYEYALSRCNTDSMEGWRYTSMCALAVIAWKCGVSKEELERDLLALLPKFNKGANSLVRQREVYSAMKMYNEKAMVTQRARLEDWQGWVYDPPKRNYRRRKEHLQAENWKNEKGRPTVNICKQNRELALQYMRENGEIKGRPRGSGSAAKVVRNWRESHPDGGKADCQRDTGLSKPTVYKWWEYEPES